MSTDLNDPVAQMIRSEVKMADAREARAYLLGALRDGTLNRTHNTIRIAQADIGWLVILRLLFSTLGSRSWIYREGRRDVWVVETTCRLEGRENLATLNEQAAFVRGYFDAEGGIPRRSTDRFYIQIVQKNRLDLERVWKMLADLCIPCGKIHNPSARVDPNYWRFYILAASHETFIHRISSWHPRKRPLLDDRFRTLAVRERAAGSPSFLRRTRCTDHQRW